MFELKIETSLKRIMNQSLKWYLKHTCLCYFQYRDGSTLCTVYTIIKKFCFNCEVLNMSNHVKCIWFILLLPNNFQKVIDILTTCIHLTHRDNHKRDYSDPPGRSILTCSCVRIVGRDMTYHNVVQMYQRGILNIKIDIYTRNDTWLFLHLFKNNV